MTLQEVTQEFALRLLEAVDLCDKDIQAAYEKRQQTIRELHKWLIEAYEEASRKE